MFKRKNLSDMAKRVARSVERSAPKPILSEAQQLAEYQQRVAKGHDGLKDVTEKHGVGGLARYLAAMERLKKKHG